MTKQQFISCGDSHIMTAEGVDWSIKIAYCYLSQGCNCVYCWL